MPQMLLYRAQVATGSSQELYAAGMPKCMRMKLGEPYLFAQGLDDLEDSVVSHAFLTPPATFDLESNDEESLGGWCTGALDRKILGHDGAYRRHGPGLVARSYAHVVVETSWDALGAVITEGASLPLGGEPRPIAGHTRGRYVYGTVDGVLRTKARIGDAVRRGDEVARLGEEALRAPLDGVLRGLTRDGVPVTAGTKVVEVDPRGRLDGVRGIGERPRGVAEGVLSAIRAWELVTRHVERGT